MDTKIRGVGMRLKPISGMFEETEDGPGVRRDHLSTEQPYRVRPKATETGPKRTLEDLLRTAPERLSL